MSSSRSPVRMAAMGLPVGSLHQHDVCTDQRGFRFLVVHIAHYDGLIGWPYQCGMGHSSLPCRARSFGVKRRRAVVIIRGIPQFEINRKTLRFITRTRELHDVRPLFARHAEIPRVQAHHRLVTHFRPHRVEGHALRRHQYGLSRRPSILSSQSHVRCRKGKRCPVLPPDSRKRKRHKIKSRTVEILSSYVESQNCSPTFLGWRTELKRLRKNQTSRLRLPSDSCFRGHYSLALYIQGSVVRHPHCPLHEF